MSSASTSRKAPPPPLNRQPSRPSLKSRSSSKSRSKSVSKSDNNSNNQSDQRKNTDEDDDDGPPTTSTLRSRTVTGSSMREFPGTPGEKGERGERDWKLPGVKGTIGGISSPRMYPPSPTISSHTTHTIDNRERTSNEESNSHSQSNRLPQNIFRIDPTMRSCLDTLNLQAAPEIRRLFGL